MKCYLVNTLPRFQKDYHRFITYEKFSENLTFPTSNETPVEYPVKKLENLIKSMEIAIGKKKWLLSCIVCMYLCISGHK